MTWTVTDNGTPPQTLTENLAITVTAVNNAPVLNNAKSPALAAAVENSGAPSGSVGTLVSSLVGFASANSQVGNVTDVDSGALLGIAVTAASTSNGTWLYSTNNGTTWSPLGSVSNSNARLLAADANTRIYFQPKANYTGTIASAITFRAWDQDQRQQRRPCQYFEQRGPQRLLLGHRHRQHHGERPLANDAALLRLLGQTAAARF